MSIVPENRERNYNTDSELLHSFFIEYNKISDYHQSLCDLSTQLCILSEHFEESCSAYNHYTILFCAISNIRELYEKIHQEYRMLHDCNEIERKILMR